MIVKVYVSVDSITLCVSRTLFLLQHHFLFHFPVDCSFQIFCSDLVPQELRAPT